MKSKYRSKLELYMDILDKCQDDLIHSEVSRKCNISHYDTTAHLTLLVDLGMMNQNEIKGKFKNKDLKPRYSWKITPYGLECLKKLVEVHGFFES